MDRRHRVCKAQSIVDSSTAKLFQDLAIALGLGLLVGLERERTAVELAGLRSFALVTILGTISSAAAIALQSPWLIAVPGLGLATMIFVHGRRRATKDPGAGFTTEAALLVMFMVGAYLPLGPRTVAVAVGAMVAVLLQFKPELHGLARRIGDRDLDAFMKFVLITFVVLPTLPRRIPGLPEGTVLDVVNPYEAWWLVVLIVGINLFGYAAYKLWGVASGMLLNGFLGGLISSTATTVANSRAVRTHPKSAGTAAVVVAVASSVVCLRVLFEVAVVEFVRRPGGQPSAGEAQLLSVMAVPMSAIFVAALVPALVVWYRLNASKPEPLPDKNPTQLRSALMFAVAYVVILVALDSAHRYLPTLGPWVVAALSGLTDMDAVTLSTARLVGGGRLESIDGRNLILIAFLSNLFFKWCLTATLGGRDLLRRVTPLFLMPCVVCLAMFVLPPARVEVPGAAPSRQAETSADPSSAANHEAQETPAATR
jgi:uncharacterized membrane protein (DUF4010 family)